MARGEGTEEPCAKGEGGLPSRSAFRDIRLPEVNENHIFVWLWLEAWTVLHLAY